MKYYIKYPDGYSTNTSIIRMSVFGNREFLSKNGWKPLHPRFLMGSYISINKEDLFITML